MLELDRDAEEVVRRRLRQPELFDGDIRPLQVLVADAWTRLRHRLCMTQLAYSQAPSDLAPVVDALLNAVERAHDLSAADAAVVRNDYAQLVGEVHLDSLSLSERSPILLPTADAVNMRRSRGRKKKQAAPARRRRLIDILRSHADGGHR